MAGSELATENLLPFFVPSPQYSAATNLKVMSVAAFRLPASQYATRRSRAFLLFASREAAPGNLASRSFCSADNSMSFTQRNIEPGLTPIDLAIDLMDKPSARSCRAWAFSSLFVTSNPCVGHLIPQTGGPHNPIKGSALRVKEVAGVGFEPTIVSYEEIAVDLRWRSLQKMICKSSFSFPALVLPVGNDPTTFRVRTEYSAN